VKQHQVSQRTCGMYNDSKRKVRLSRLSMGEGDSHINDAGNVTPASDVS
jgi:hypothetical protein